MKPIRILSPTLDLLGEVDNYLSLSFGRNYHLPGEFQFVTNLKVQNADQLNINNLIMLGADKHKTGIIRHREITTNEDGEEVLAIKGYTLGVITRQRITIPPAGQDQDVIEADAETVMKHYVQRNCLDIPGMEFSMLVIATNQCRGPTVKWQSRYKNLADELEQISKLTCMGWHIYPDFDTGKWIFDVYEGRYLTTGQSTLPPVIFSPEFDNVQGQEFVDSLAGYGNYAIVAGQGEGAERTIAMVGSNDTGLDRHVIFVDARDVESPSDLPARGEAQLAEYQRVLSFQSEVLPTGPFQYEVDWDVGDLVTLQNKEWGVTMDARITEVTEIYEASGFKLDVTFGNSLPTLIQKLKQELRNVSNEVLR